MRITALSIYTEGLNSALLVKVEAEGEEKLCACYTAFGLQGGQWQALHEIFTQYDTRALKVRRTRERVILRFLKYLKDHADLMATELLTTGNYYRLVRLSEPLQIFNTQFSDNRFYGEFRSNAEFANAIAQLVARTRAYGPRPTRRLNPEPKPMRFKRLWQASYHSSDMGGYPSKETGFSAEAGNFKMGLELELNYTGEVLGDSNYLYMSEDGSLHDDYGAEFVTRPDSAKVHAEELEEFLKVNKLRPDHHCGMHVHVAKSMLTATAISKIRKRVYHQDRTEFTQKVIARRSTNNYWNLSTDSYDMEGKYTAVNVRGYRTIEFRLFSGTANLHLIKRRMQWVNAICKWACGYGRVRGARPVQVHSNPDYYANMRVTETVIAESERSIAIGQITQRGLGAPYVCTDGTHWNARLNAVNHQMGLNRMAEVGAQSVNEPPF